MSPSERGLGGGESRGWECAGRDAVCAVLRRERPARFVYAPNYWQWLNHQRRHGTLPDPLQRCETQLQLLRYLGVDVLSRNIYCDPMRCWFGGLSEVEWDGVDVETTETSEGRDLVINRRYRTRAGELAEQQRFVHDESTLVQTQFLVEEPERQIEALEELVRARRWRVLAERLRLFQEMVGDDGLVMAGEAYSPLKLLYLSLGAERAVYFLADQPERAAEIMAVHEAAQLDLIRQMAAAGAPVVMSMDNLDTALHPPRYVERYSASFYEKASRICHKHGVAFFIHACGQQRANLALIASLGVDGLEGVAHPPLGDVELDEAMRRTGDRFIITGGVTAAETDRLRSRGAVARYVKKLFDRMRPFAHRFVFASGCNTAITASGDQLLWFRDAWREYGGLLA